MKEFRKGRNKLNEVKAVVKEYGEFAYSFKNWNIVTIEENELTITRKDGTTVYYKNVHGTFTNPTVLN